MTDKEQQLMDYVISAQSSIHDAIAQADVRPLANALRKLQAMQILIEAPVVTKQWPEVTPIYETPEQPKIDKAALDIIKAPIADEVPLETPKATISQETIENMIRDSEPKPKRKKKVRLDDFDVPLSEKEEAMDRDEKIYYMRAQGFTLSTIAKKVGCSPQTVLNVINRRKQKEQQRLKSEAAYSDPEGGRKK